MPQTVKATEYLRVSKDASGRLRSVDEQDAENRQAAEAHGWTLGEPYIEAAAASASRYARKRRPGFDRLVADLETGRFRAEVLILWEPSRGSRRLSEWARFLEQLEARGVRLHVTSHSRTYDLTNPRDRRSLHEDGTDSEYESGKVSMRARRAQAGQAAAGRPNGAVPFGYRRRYDPQTRRLVAQEPEPAEAKIVRELYERLAAGHSLRSIALDFEARGIRSRNGKVLSMQVLRGMATRRAYIGERVHRPADGPATVTEAVWPPLVDRVLWQAVHRRFSAATRRSPRTGRARHLLSMIARCDPCGGPLAVTYRKDRGPGTPPQYYCRDKGCVRATQADVDDLAEAVMLSYLAEPDRVERLTAGDGDDQALADARAAIAEIRAELDDLADQVGRGDLSATLAARAEPAIRRRLQQAEAHEADLATPPRLRALITPGADVARRWKAAPISARREIARILLTPEILGELRITRSPTPGRPAPITERVVWDRSTASAPRVASVPTTGR
jgi:DNA invertase Pin-like site-specific DNA recombinase